MKEAEKFQWICKVAVAIIPVLVLIAHSLLYAMGKMASNGEVRYMLIVAPFWAILSARGWEWLWLRLDFRSPYRVAAVASLVPILANFYWKVLPLRLYKDWTQARQIVQWYEKSDLSHQYPRLSAAHQALYYFMNIPGDDDQRAIDFRRDTLLPKALSGTIIVWDPVYAIFNSDQRRKVPLDDLLAAGWIDVTAQMPHFGDEWHILLSPVGQNGEPLPAEMR